jgi:hypothetical protein
MTRKEIHDSQLRLVRQSVDVEDPRVRYEVYGRRVVCSHGRNTRFCPFCASEKRAA